MTAHSFDFGGQRLDARASGGLFWPARRWLVVSDLHLGKSERMARRGGALLPPYETEATLDRLEAEIAATDPDIVVSLGDGFDD
ncbi:MAG: ligase-associated DNA damage response endonuclease PdeM, partial [Paracoccus sp. (in: a-proteobacteria)]